jgi:hypothetical protein
MDSTQATAYIQALRNQRNQAYDGLAIAQSELASAKDVIAALQKQNSELRDSIANAPNKELQTA